MICLSILYKTSGWNAHAIVRSHEYVGANIKDTVEMLSPGCESIRAVGHEYKRCRHNTGLYTETSYDVMSILIVR